MDDNCANKTQYIVDYIQESCPDFAISENLLNHPTSEFVIAFNQRFRDAMLDIRAKMIENEVDEDELPVQNAATDTIFSLIHFVNSYLPAAILEPDQDYCIVTLTDLYDPTAKRTKIRFKLLVHVLSFYESKVSVINDIVTKHRSRASERKQKLENIQQVKVNLANESEALAHLETEHGILQRDEEKAKHRYEKLKMQSDAQQRHIQKLKHDMQEIMNTHQNKLELLTNLKTNIDALNGEVVCVESYKSLTSLQANLVKKKSELESQLENIAANLENRTPVIERYANISIQVDKIDSYCNELEQLQNSNSEKSAQVQMLDHNCKDKENQLLKLGESKIQFEKHIVLIKKTTHSNKNKDECTIEELKQKEEQLKIELAKKKILHENIACESDDLNVDILKLHSEYNDLILKNKNLNVSYENTYRNMRNTEASVVEFFNSVLQCLAIELDGYNKEDENSNE